MASKSKKDDGKEKKYLGKLSFKLDYDFQKGQVIFLISTNVLHVRILSLVTTFCRV